MFGSFYLLIFDALNDINKGIKEKFSLQEKAIEALKPSVVFASELAKKEIESAEVRKCYNRDAYAYRYHGRVG